MQMAPSFIPQGSFRSEDHGLSLQRISMIYFMHMLTERIIYNTVINDDDESDLLLEKPAVELAPKDKKAAAALLEAEAESARSYIEKLFFNTKKYDLGDVGRYKINYKLGTKIDPHITI